MGVATVTAIVGLGMATYKTIDENNKKKKAARALKNLEQPELKNVADGMEVSTLGADSQREEQSRLAATQVDALRGAGTRGIFGGLGRVEAGNQKVAANIAADLDMQQKEIDKIRANDDQAIRGIKEDRHNANVAALSSQYNAAQDGQNQGMANMLQAGAMAAQNYSAGQSATTGRTPVEAANPTTAGITNPSGLKASTGLITQQPITASYSPTSSGPRMGGLRSAQYDESGNPIY